MKNTRADLESQIEKLYLLARKKQSIVVGIEKEINNLHAKAKSLRDSLDMKLEFETGTEDHFDTGTVWIGYLIDIHAESEQKPGKCIKCKEWFTKETNMHSVERRYVYHEVDGHDIIHDFIGYICQECFEKAKQERKICDGKLH